MRHINLILTINLCASFLLAQHQTSLHTISMGQSTSVDPPADRLDINGNNDWNPTEDEPYVFWVHGLNGDIGSWADAALASEQNVATSFRARKLKSVTDIDYSQSNGLEEAGGQFKRIIEQYRASQASLGEDPTKNFIIAHSQGGMVTRAMLHTDHCIDFDPNEILGYGGAVTYGTPHGGALILNNKLKFGPFSTEMCQALGLAPALEIAYNKSFKFKILGIQFAINLGRVLPVEKVVDQVCQFMDDVLIPGLTLIQTPRITEDYEVGARYLQKLNERCENSKLSEMDKVAFYGVENDRGLMFRTLKYFGLSVNALNYFEANEDEDAVMAFDQNRMQYLSKVEYYKSRLQILNAAHKAFGCDNLYRRLKNYTSCREIERKIESNKALLKAWEDGVNWFGSVDDNYKKIIGALVYQTRKENWCSCLDKSTGRTTEYKLDPGEACVSPPSFYCREFIKTIIDKIYKPSDGVVLAESASDWPDATVVKRLDRSSHMQMRNDVNTKATLTQLYNGDYGDAFKVDPI